MSDFKLVRRDLLRNLKKLKKTDVEIQRLQEELYEKREVISEAFKELLLADPYIGDIAIMDISLAIRRLVADKKRIEAAFLKEWIWNHGSEGYAMSQEKREMLWVEDRQRAHGVLEKLNAGE